MKLSYTDETDRCYGATGMAIGIVIFDGEDMLASVNLDAGSAADMMEYVPDFYFSGNPAVSAKAAWNRILRNYNLSMAATISNVLCRAYMGSGRAPGRDVTDYLRSIAIDEGSEVCNLDRDEIEGLFDKNMRYLQRVFSHSGVQSVARDFAGALRQSRRMSRLEVMEQLRALSSF